MIKYERFTLDNGLRVLVHEDHSTPLVSVNVLYDVGARDEDPERTGFAHLFEHLMFGGSVNIPEYDKPLQQVGAVNNAFTNNDITNYYITIPSNNLETAFWLESDRMLGLDFSERSLEVQRNVVIEEFKQRYLNQPYGDAWLLLRPLAFRTHPYQWPTIGKEIAHIEEAQLDDVKAFFKKHYAPMNAILTVAGNTTKEEVQELAKKWFEPIPSGIKHERRLPQEPAQDEFRELNVKRRVPADCLFMAFHIGGRMSPEYYSTDLLSDILGRGRSSRLHLELVKRQKLMGDVAVYVTGEFDPGLFVITGRLASGARFDQVEDAIWSELEKLAEVSIPEEEVAKVKNKVISSTVFGEMNIENRSLGLAIAELLGDPELVNTELEHYQQVSEADLKEQAGKIFRKENTSVLRIEAEL